MTKNSKEPIGSYEHMADAYAERVDLKPIHVFYERPGTWSLLPDKLTGLKVLDVGCGSGWYAEQLAKAGCVVTAIDASQKMVDLTAQRLQGKGKCVRANLEEGLNFLPNHEFDIILAPLVIHYVEDWESLFKEFARVLKSGGLFIFSTHQPHTAFHLFNLDNYFTKQIIKDRWEDPKVEVQYYHHTLHDLTESLYKAGFIIERMVEPLPQAGLKQNDKLYQHISHQPWFLFVRARLL